MKHLVLAAALACTASIASATTLDFETANFEYGAEIPFGGFSFSFSADGWFLGTFFDFYPDGVTNGTGILVASGDRNSSPASVTMTRVGGGTFDLFGLLAASSNRAIGNTLSIVGNLSGGGSVTRSIGVGSSFASVDLVGFEGLTSVIFSSQISGGYNRAGFALDDLRLEQTVAPIPVPATLPLLLLALGGIGMVRRARVA